MSQKSQKHYRIALGSRWSSFAYEREGMEMLGTVQRGMQIGALAKLPDGSYAQVNGDVVEALNRSRVEFALVAANKRAGTQEFHFAKPPSAPAPTVVIKKRRKIVMSGDA